MMWERQKKKPQNKTCFLTTHFLTCHRLIQKLHYLELGPQELQLCCHIVGLVISDEVWQVGASQLLL